VRQTREFIKTGKVGRVATVTIDHPPTNSISTGILQDLAALVAEYEADDAVRAILLDTANEKPPFAADATDLLANPSWENQLQLIQAGGRALSAIEFSSKPVVMAIYDGVCMGGALELALACHIRVAGKGTYSRFLKLSPARCRAGATRKGSSTISDARRRSNSC
jgi:enoyl-CoA hydratase